MGEDEGKRMQENLVEMMRQEKGIPGTVEQEKGPKITWQGDNKSPVSKEREREGSIPRRISFHGTTRPGKRGRERETLGPL